jgi:hypothetical protein
VRPDQIVTWAARSAGMIAADEEVDSAESVIERFDWRKLPTEKIVVNENCF